MITLIAESKTMRGGESPLSPDTLESRLPLTLPEANRIIEEIQQLDSFELAEILKVSRPMALKALSLAYDFPAHSTGCEAIEAFTGVVFRALDYASLDSAAKEYVDENVRIISSLYGLLRPTNIIKPYRLEYNAWLSPDGDMLWRHWRKQVTDILLREAEKRQDPVIIDLLPADAAKTVDFDRLRKAATVCKIEFRQLMPGGTFRTPNAGRLKQLRGQLLRQMALHHVTDLATLRTLSTPTFTPTDPDITPTDPAFIDSKDTSTASPNVVSFIVL